MAVSLLTVSLFAQNYHYTERKASSVAYPNQFLFSPFYFWDGTFMLSYERIFPSGALRITPSIKLQNIDDKYYSQREGWGLDLGYKFFLSSRPYKVNFYLGPYALYKNTKVKSRSHQVDDMLMSVAQTYNILGIGVDTGVKFIFGRFTMDISMGGGIRYAYLDGYNYDNSGVDWWEIDYKGIVPRGNISFGVCF